MAKQRHQFYTFDAGINYRDQNLAMNELRSGTYNVYWTGKALRKRSGYVKRNAALDISSVWASGSIIGIEEYYYYHYRSSATVTEEFDLWTSIDSGGGSTADKLVLFYVNDLPDSTSESFTLTESSTAHGLSWTDGDPISAVVFVDTVWVTNGSDNPYIVGGYDTPYSEVPICSDYNAGGTSVGAEIIDNSTSGETWDGCKWLGVQDQFIYLSDNKTMFFGIADQDVYPHSEMSSSSAATRIDGVQEAMDSAWYFSLAPQSRPDGITVYRDYMFLYGQEDIWHLYHRYSDTTKAGYDKQRISDKGAWSNLCVTPRAAFWVSYDGIYGYDGVNTINLSKKIWPHIEEQHTTIPDNLTNTSVAYHDNKVWISFPDSSAKEIFIFEPDHIYQDNLGDQHAPFYLFTYVDSSDDAIAFYNLKDYDGHLFATNGSQLYELDTGYTDDGQGIDYEGLTAYLDFDNPAFKKTYGRLILEVSPDDASDVGYWAYRDYGEDSEELGEPDVNYTSDERVFVEMTVPYQIDGNSFSLRFRRILHTGSVYNTDTWYFYGFSVEAEVKDYAKKER
jgi:hypothetical protein